MHLSEFDFFEVTPKATREPSFNNTITYVIMWNWSETEKIV